MFPSAIIVIMQYIFYGNFFVLFLCILNDLLEAGYEDVPGLGQGGAEYDVALADLESNQ